MHTEPTCSSYQTLNETSNGKVTVHIFLTLFLDQASNSQTACFYVIYRIHQPTEHDIARHLEKLRTGSLPILILSYVNPILSAFSGILILILAMWPGLAFFVVLPLPRGSSCSAKCHFHSLVCHCPNATNALPNANSTGAFTQLLSIKL